LAVARWRLACATGAAASAACLARAETLLPKELDAEAERDVVVENWSSTHQANPRFYFQPDGPQAVQRILSALHQLGQRVRVVGSALSPNGLGLSDEAMLNMAQCAEIVSVDPARLQVTVQAGARVSEVVEALRPHGMTLQNYASIAEQQIGGFIQVGAHGTGAAIPPVDMTVVRMKLHTPGLGEMELSESSNPRLFRLAKVGLGLLGVVSEVTLQCVPAHKLVQHTFTETREGIARRHHLHLKHKHMRYMWIPHTDTVVVVTCDPAPEGMVAPPPSFSEDQMTAPLRDLLVSKKGATAEAARSMNFAQLRDALIALDPLDKAHIVEVNRAEAEFWKRAGGYRIDWSDKLLGFECGGQQWVSEVAFPCGTRSVPNGADLQFMQDLLELAEGSKLAVPAPIEQRWTAGSKSRMSPASSEGDEDLHSWVGIIMYLPTQEQQARDEITAKFWEYNDMCRRLLWPKYNCHQHWAKIEIPDAPDQVAAVRQRLRERFPIDEFNSLRRELDPKNILGNALTDTLLGDEAAHKSSGI